MESNQIHQIIQKQRKYFDKGNTFDVNGRIEHLKKLKQVIIENEVKINEAVYQDLGKSNVESYMCETGMVLSELSYMIKHIKTFSKKQRVRTPLSQFHAKSYRLACPYGIVLVMSPWNYPFMLSMDPLIDAISAGNTVILKPSAYSPNTSKVIQDILEKVFCNEYVSVIQGGRKENQALLEEKFDYIFFTGSPSVGHEVMAKASVHLTPVTLELGGKSPCIVDQSANLKLAARRIVFGKFLNLGQTCVAPDYVYVHHSIKDQFISYVIDEIKTQFSDLSNYGKIINQKHFDRLFALMDTEKIVYGGKVDRQTLKIEPTLFDNISWDDAIMKEEIFGPLLPILTFDSIRECLDIIKDKPSPLALYFFSTDQNKIDFVTNTVPFGGGCINDTIIHLATSNMPFGGVGNSGMGAYHGKVGFETFTHFKSIVDKKNWIDMPMRYQPYTKKYEKMIRFFLK